VKKLERKSIKKEKIAEKTSQRRVDKTQRTGVSVRYCKKRKKEKESRTEKEGKRREENREKQGK